MKKALVTLVVLGAIGGSVFGYYRYGRSTPAPNVTTSPVTRGAISDAVGATGTLQAVTTVQVGSQVSGTIHALYADFNSLVHKGQVIARLDPSLFETQIEQANANLVRAQADLERLKVTLDDARTKLSRARELAARQLIAQTELDVAEVAVRSTEAQIRSAEASVRQAQASLNQNNVNLQHTVITAPIDGLVISRNVDVGQTVAASMNAPILFVLAADLTKMQVVANLDESDVGRIRPGQRVSFRVDAYPAEDFTGSVAQVRLQPIVQQNVVTYATVIDVANPQLKLKPGMTANVNIEIARRTDAVRVPNAALRFRPTNDMFAALGQTPPDVGGGMSVEGSGTPGARPPGEAGGLDGAGAPLAARPPPEGSGSGGREGAPSLERGVAGGRGLAAERMQTLSPEMMERMRARGFDPSRAGGGARGRGGADAPQPPAVARNPEATTIDALFGPLPQEESTGRVWLYADNQLRPVRVRLGITDGQATELLEGDLQAGTAVVTNVTTGNESRPAAAGAGGLSPFMPGRGFRGR